MKSSLKIQGIDVFYDARQVLSGITLEVERGEFVGVIGPNGCGKTTLLRTITRVLRPKSGVVLLDDADIWSISSSRLAREMAVVPQDTGTVFDFSCLEVVLMGRSPHLSRFEVEGSRDVEIAREAMSMTGTLHLAERSVNTLSGGELQRVVIARGLAQQPEVLMLDEPTSHLDLAGQFDMLDLVRRLNRERSLTVLAVLHDLNLAAQYCDRLVMMGGGKIKAMGTPEEVLTVENVRSTYGAEVWVRRHPASGRPYIIAGVNRISKDLKGFGESKVHIICGGGAGAPVMAKLLRRGFEVSAGVLNEGDTDLEVAESLGIECATCPPFTAISSEAESVNLGLIEQADYVVLADIPFGQWNLPNLQAAKRAVELGKTLIILRPESIGERDFTGGAACVVESLLASGAKRAGDLDELVKVLGTE